MVAALLLGTAAYGMARSGQADGLSAQLSEARDAVANAVGFRIDSIALTGQKQLTREEILAIAGVTGAKSAAAEAIRVAVERLKRATSLPVAVGFGVREPEAALEPALVAPETVTGGEAVPAR